MEFGISGQGFNNPFNSFGFGAFNTNIKTCGNCEYTDGMCYTSNPPKRKCTIDKNYYDYGHKCHFKFAPVIEGKWNQIQRWATKAKYQCSVCGRTIMSAVRVNMEKYPYCHCGAKMSEGEVLR